MTKPALLVRFGVFNCQPVTTCCLLAHHVWDVADRLVWRRETKPTINEWCAMRSLVHWTAAYVKRSKPQATAASATNLSA